MKVWHQAQSEEGGFSLIPYGSPEGEVTPQSGTCLSQAAGVEVRNKAPHSPPCPHSFIKHVLNVTLLFIECLLSSKHWAENFIYFTTLKTQPPRKTATISCIQ